jgi:hypothetical protein
MPSTAGLIAMLERLFPGRVRTHAALAPLTTFRVGGRADALLETRSADEMTIVLALAHQMHVPVTILGGGSNVLVSDAGVRGLVLRPRGGQVRPEGKEGVVGAERVRADAAVTINGLVRWTINHGCAGLEAWAGTPGLLVYVMVDDIEAAVRDVVAAGGEIVQAVGMDAPELTARFRDPGGNVVGLYQEPVKGG